MSKKPGTIKYILSLPFLGIYYVFDFLFKVIEYFFVGFYSIFKPVFTLFKYVSLGCYYSLYGLLFPFIYLIKKIGNELYKNRQKKSDINLNDIAPLEAVNMSTEETNMSDNKPKNQMANFDLEEESVSSYIKRKIDNLSFVRKKREKEAQKAKELILTIQKENLRSEKPIAFKYVAIGPDDKKITNTFIALSKMEVLSFLTTENYRVLSIETSKLINFLYGPEASTYFKFKNKDLIFWLTQLSTYIKSGIPLTDAMRILSKQMSNNPRKKRLFDSIIYNLTLGESFSSALSKQGKSFPALLISMIKTAEATGELEQTLDDMANYYTEIENTRKAMISAMLYPSIISIFSIAVVVFLMLYVIPQFKDIYATSGAEINSFTLSIISFSKFLEDNIFYLLIGLILIVVLIVVLYKKIKSVRKSIQEIAMRMPVIKNIIIYKEMSVFAKTFASLLKNNVFITESINLLSEVTNNEIYKSIMYKTVNNIAKGDKISKAFYKHWAVPEVAYFMIVTGESTGELANMMNKVAEHFSAEHKNIVNTLKSFIEPAMIIFLAVIVGGIIMAIILPMFGLYSNIG